MKIGFSWDDGKNKINQKRHGVSFEQASEIFFNFPLEVFHDPDNSEQDDRYIAVGYCNNGRCLLVVHCENPKGAEIRIISARKATKREQRRVFGEEL